MKSHTENTAHHNTELRPSLTVSAAREQLTTLIQGIDETPSRVIGVKRRNRQIALFISEARYGAAIEGIENGDLIPILSTMITIKLMGTKVIPHHLFQPQIDELMTMTEDQLLQLKSADTTISIDSLVKKGGFNKTLIERLIKRRKICLAIAKAKSEALYDISEHLSGSESD